MIVKDISDTSLLLDDSQFLYVNYFDDFIDRDIDAIVFHLVDTSTGKKIGFRFPVPPIDTIDVDYLTYIVLACKRGIQRLKKWTDS